MNTLTPDQEKSSENVIASSKKSSISFGYYITIFATLFTTFVALLIFALTYPSKYSYALCVVYFVLNLVIAITLLVLRHNFFVSGDLRKFSLIMSISIIVSSFVYMVVFLPLALFQYVNPTTSSLSLTPTEKSLSVFLPSSIQDLYSQNNSNFSNINETITSTYDIGSPTLQYSIILDEVFSGLALSPVWDSSSCPIDNYHLLVNGIRLSITASEIIDSQGGVTPGPPVSCLLSPNIDISNINGIYVDLTLTDSNDDRDFVGIFTSCGATDISFIFNRYFAYFNLDKIAGFNKYAPIHVQFELFWSDEELTYTISSNDFMNSSNKNLYEGSYDCSLRPNYLSIGIVANGTGYIKSEIHQITIYGVSD